MLRKSRIVSTQLREFAVTVILDGNPNPFTFNLDTRTAAQSLYNQIATELNKEEKLPDYFETTQ